MKIRLIEKEIIMVSYEWLDNRQPRPCFVTYEYWYTVIWGPPLVLYTVWYHKNMVKRNMIEYNNAVA